MQTTSVYTNDGGGGLSFEYMLGARDLLDKIVKSLEEMNSTLDLIPLKHSGAVGLSKIDGEVDTLYKAIKDFRDSANQTMTKLKEIDKSVKNG